MKAILTYSTVIDGKKTEQTGLFDTDNAKKICGIKNGFGWEIEEIYITEKGTIFTYNLNYKKIEIPEQKSIKEWIGANEPDEYIKFFGKVEEG